MTLVVKNRPAHAGDARDTASGLRRSPGGGSGNPLQYSCLGDPMDRGTWWAIVPWGCNESDTTEQLGMYVAKKVLSQTVIPVVESREN